LRGVGKWLQTHGEAIYGTTASPFAQLPWGRATRKADMLYLLVFDWPSDGALRVPAKATVDGIRLLGSSAPVAVAATDAGLLLELPGKPTDAACSVVALHLTGDLVPLPFAVGPAADGAFALTPHDATLHGPQLRIERVGAVGDVTYNLGYWLDPAAHASWPIVVERAGRYAAVAEIACKDESAGAECTLACGDAKVAFRVAGTGGWQRYRTIELGELTLPAGRSEIALRATSKPGEAVLNLRSLRLVPR
jgi:alpha-L-fucosidase